MNVSQAKTADLTAAPHADLVVEIIRLREILKTPWPIEILALDVERMTEAHRNVFLLWLRKMHIHGILLARLDGSEEEFHAAYEEGLAKVRAAKASETRP